jgi:hypothetical protein
MMLLLHGGSETQEENLESLATLDSTVLPMGMLGTSEGLMMTPTPK